MARMIPCLVPAYLAAMYFVSITLRCVRLQHFFMVVGAVSGPNYILKFSTSLALLMVVGAVPGPDYILKFSTSLALLMVVGAVSGPAHGSGGRLWPRLYS